MSKASDAGAVGELFTLTGTPNTPSPGTGGGRTWMYVCVLCDTLTAVEPGELCGDCGDVPPAPAPARRPRTAKKTARAAKKPRTSGKATARRGGES